MYLPAHSLAALRYTLYCPQVWNTTTIESHYTSAHSPWVTHLYKSLSHNDGCLVSRVCAQDHFNLRTSAQQLKSCKKLLDAAGLLDEPHVRACVRVVLGRLLVLRARSERCRWTTARDLVHWSRKDHLMFNLATRRFVLLLLWLNKYSMKFPDDVLDLLIKASLQSM